MPSLTEETDHSPFKRVAQLPMGTSTQSTAFRLSGIKTRMTLSVSVMMVRCANGSRKYLRILRNAISCRLLRRCWWMIKRLLNLWPKPLLVVVIADSQSAHIAWTSQRVNKKHSTQVLKTLVSINAIRAMRISCKASWMDMMLQSLPSTSIQVSANLRSTVKCQTSFSLVPWTGL